MNELAAAFLQFSQDGVWIGALVFLRVGAAMALLPGFGEQVTPMRVKLGAAMAFALIVAPVIWDDLQRLLATKSWTRLVGAEVLAGLAIGILFRLFVIALQVAGTVAAQATSLSQIFGAGLGAEPQPAMSTLLVVAGLCLAAMAGLHVRAAEALILSYEMFPPGRVLPTPDLTGWGVARVAHAFGLGVMLAAPFLIASVIYNLALGVINRAMPQLMVAFVGAPAISFGGIVLLMLVIPIMLNVWFAAFIEATGPGLGAP